MGQTLLEICRDEHMPDRTTVWDWREAHPEFANAYTRAQAARAELWADEIVTISDDATNDWMDRETRDGTIRVIDHEHVMRSRLRVDTRKWIVSKLLPKFRDKPMAEDSGTDNTLKIVNSPDAD